MKGPLKSVAVSVYIQLNFHVVRHTIFKPVQLIACFKDKITFCLLIESADKTTRVINLYTTLYKRISDNQQ